MICERLWFSSFCMELHIRQDSPIENNCLGTLVLMVLPTQCKLDQNNPPQVAQAPLQYGLVLESGLLWTCRRRRILTKGRKGESERQLTDIITEAAIKVKSLGRILY